MTTLNDNKRLSTKMHKIPQPINAAAAGKKPKNNIGNMITKKIQAKVSKKKRRFVDKVNGFNLDLTYITKRIIAMGFPSEGNEAMYRNPASEVKRFFNTYHAQKFKVYNLCIEKDRQYPLDKFADVGGLCAKFGFKDHNAPQLELILAFCQDLHEWLGKDKDNVAAIHCKAGKGRTGVMICAYLAYSKICKNAQESLLKYGQARTKNAKGVTIPSQRRFVLYFSNFVMNPSISPNPSQFDFYRVCILKRVRMNSIPDFDIGGGCDPYFVILSVKGEILYDYSEHNAVKPQRSFKKKKRKKGKKKSEILSNSVSSPIVQNEAVEADEIVKFRDVDIILRGAFKIVFYDKDVLSSDDIMCWCWLHSAISSRERHIYLERDEVDGAVKDTAYKHFARNFSLEFWFSTPLDTEEEKRQIEPDLKDWICSKSHHNQWPLQQPEHRKKRKKNHRAVTRPVMSNYHSGPVDVGHYDHYDQYQQQQQQQQQQHREPKRKKMQRTVSRPIMRNIQSANSPNPPPLQEYDENLDVVGDTNFDEHVRRKRKKKKPKMNKVHSVGSTFAPEDDVSNQYYMSHNVHSVQKKKRKKKNNRAVSKPELRNHQSMMGFDEQNKDRKLKKRYSNPKATQIHNFQQSELFQKQQRRNNNDPYYQNGNVEQPIPVNGSMMNTLRQNMQHHMGLLGSDSDEWRPNRKSTMV